MTDIDENRLKQAVKRLGIEHVQRVTCCSQTTILRAIAGIPLYKSTDNLLQTVLPTLEKEPPQAA